MLIPTSTEMVWDRPQQMDGQQEKRREGNISEDLKTWRADSADHSKKVRGGEKTQRSRGPKWH